MEFCQEIIMSDGEFHEIMVLPPSIPVYVEGPGIWRRCHQLSTVLKSHRWVNYDPYTTLAVGLS